MILRSVLVRVSMCLLTLSIMWHLYASHTRSLLPKLSDPHTQSIQSFVRISLIQPFWLNATTTPGTFVSSATGRTPLKTTNGFSFLPSAISASMTVNLPLSWPVVQMEIDRAPDLETVVSPHMSSHKGVSSMLPMDDKA